MIDVDPLKRPTTLPSGGFVTTQKWTIKPPEAMNINAAIRERIRSKKLSKLIIY